MASFSISKVASPRSLAGAFVSPKIVLHRPRAELIDSLPLSSLKKSHSLSPYVAYLSPHSNESSPLKKTTLDLTRRFRSVRKLPWSDRGEHSSLEVYPISDSLLSHHEISSSVCEHSHNQASVDTPKRAEMLHNFKHRRRISNVLGRGSFGTVIEALYKGEAVAVKIILQSTEASKQLANEANSLELHHPNIVSIMKVVPCNVDVAGMVIMERITGYSLQLLLDQDPLSRQVEKRLRYSMHICSALAFCHKNELLHLDVKPQNVLVDILTDTCKLCDFGCSSKIGAKVVFPLGTVGYAAPEILQGLQPSTAADIYSLGITMWQLMSGETPFKDMRAHTVIYKVVSSEFRPPLPSALSAEEEEFVSLLKRCWSQPPQCRPSAHQVFLELQEGYKKVCCMD